MLERVFPGRSDLARRMREFDWSATDLGPPERWPETLRVALGLCLTSPVPMQVWWGPRLTVLYNDAFVPLVGPDKHPGILGRPALEVWPEIRSLLDPILDRVLATGEASWPDEVPLFVDLRAADAPEDATFSFGPIFGRSGRVEGLFGQPGARSRTRKPDAPLGEGSRSAREGEQALAEAARESEQRYRKLFNSISEAYVLKEAVRDGDGKIVDFRLLEVNPAFADQTGLSDVVGRTMREITPSLAEEWIEKIANVVQTGVSSRYQLHSAAADRWFDVLAWPIETERDRVAMLFRDVTARKGAERTAMQLSQRLTSLLDNVPLAVAEYDAEYRITRWSTHAERMFGWTADEVVGAPFTAMPIIHKDDEARVMATLAPLFDPSTTGVVCSNRNTAKDGRVLHCQWYNSVLHNETGRTVAILSIALDLTDRERTEAALRESEARLARQKEAFQLAVNGAPLEASLDVLLRMAVEQSGSGARALFFLVDEQRSRLRAVRGAGNMPDDYVRTVDGCEIGPRTPACGSAAYFGRPVITPDIDEDPLWAPLLPLAREHGVRACWSFPIQTLSGRVLGTLALYHVERREATPRDIDLAGVVTHAAAIIISRHQEAEVRQAAEAALRDADRRKDEFLATLAHELRNPLAPIRSAVDVMRLAGDQSAVTLQARQTIERQLSQLIRLVDDLLDVSRITRDKIELRKERVALSTIVQNAVETSRPLIEASGHALTVKLPQEIVWLDADVTRLSQVLSNLLNNAAKYTPEHGHISLTAVHEAGEVAIRVRDSGIGIPGERLADVFSLFTQIDSSRSRSQGGLGLGLTIVKRLVEMHGGSVSAASEPGAGSEFTVRLPVMGIDSWPSASTEIGSQPILPGHRVLVVDDNRDAASTLGAVLRMMGNHVRIANDGWSALDITRHFHPELALLDIGMPGMDGYELARRLREQSGRRGVLLVALTGWGQEEDRKRSLDAGFDYHLTKPAEIDALQKLLAALSVGGAV